MQQSWGKQADATTIEANRRLREEYQKTGGKGMSQGDQERARILIARDKRKQEKKRRQKQDHDNGCASKDSYYLYEWKE